MTGTSKPAADGHPHHDAAHGLIGLFSHHKEPENPLTPYERWNKEMDAGKISWPPNEIHEHEMVLALRRFNEARSREAHKNGPAGDLHELAERLRIDEESRHAEQARLAASSDAVKKAQLAQQATKDEAAKKAAEEAAKVAAQQKVEPEAEQDMEQKAEADTEAEAEQDVKRDVEDDDEDAVPAKKTEENEDEQ
ncbi:hypothetical protein B0T26DRAFT_678330 [Lasiosphaeria miniovina]|uniref:Uncharacterized protein n=1 Tax=Lasiosphaeria miniovina TaxID=1954250 RepID=A0AA40AEA2_9PEZI|nr:uncharacterized protein B0T26DRAFT_678330 [Lasiosphaeria miniovina]KAK0714073.1 hypothetical protein B0T26DRAFT_678330 [Lasiosphaeria miniovina]